MDISWKNYVYNIFDSKKITGKSEELNKRRRNLILSISPDRHYTIDELIKINIETAIAYKDLSSRTISRDINELINLELLSIDEDGLYYANFDLLKKFMPRRVDRTK